MKAARILSCTCCGAEITAPQFFNGKPYGWTCIKKVAPAAKQVKFKFFAVDSAVIIRSRALNENRTMYAVNVVYNGKKYLLSVFDNQMTEQSGVTFIREDVFKK